MKSRYQLIVIGAGPAGGYAALTAAQGGLDTLLIERSPEVGFPLACAEGTSHDGLTKFIDPDPQFISSRIDTLGFKIATGFEFTYRPQDVVGYVLDRPSFDHYLAQKAEGHGAELMTGAYACGLEIVENKPAAVTVRTKAGTEVIIADYIIAADGVESMIGRMAGIDTSLELHQTDSSLQYRVSGIDLDPRRLEFYMGKKYSSDGYLWVFPKSAHSANVGLAQNPAENDNRELRNRLDRFLKEHYDDYTVEFECGGMVPKFLGFDILGRDCLLLAGDAARAIDSLTGAGICRALHTGQLAAHAIIGACEGAITRENLVAEYRKSVDGEIGRELRFFAKAHTVFRKFNDEDWESIAIFLEKFVSKQKAGSMDPAVLIKSALAGAPRLARLARHLI